MKVAIVTVRSAGDPYDSFAELSETLCLAFRALDYECVQSDQFYLNRLNIVLGATKLEFTPELPARTVIYNLEQVFDGSRQLKPDYLRFLSRYHVWDYSRRNIEALEALGIAQVTYVPVGYMPELTRIRPQMRI